MVSTNNYVSANRYLQRGYIQPKRAVPPVPFFKMGVQSQLRCGSIQSCMKRGGKTFKFQTPKKQMTMTGQRAFNPIIDCKVCKAQYHNKYAGAYNKVTVPKKAHHVLCKKRKPPPGDRTVEVERIAAENIEANNRPIEDLGHPGTSAAEKAAALFPPNQPKPTATTAATRSPEPDSPMNSETLTPLATELRQVLDENISNLSDEELATELDGMGPPLAIRCLLKYITSQFQHSKTKGANTLPKSAHFAEQMIQYRRFFVPGEVVFTFPQEKAPGTEMNPFYHSLEGTKIFVIDWMLSHERSIPCPSCNKGNLQHDRSSFSHNGTIFPVLMKSGDTMWGSVMWYECPECKKRWAGNDQEVLGALTERVSQSYPVEPRYATGSFHLSVDVSDDVDSLMKTYGNGNMLARTLFQKQAKAYLRKVSNYLLCGSENTGLDYVPFDHWIGIFPPSGKTIRSLYEKAERSSTTLTGLSNYDRYKREIQSVGAEKAVAADHTFQALKNYNLPGAKALFTMNNERGEIVTAAIVPDTKVQSVAHLVEQQVRRRKHFRPNLIYTDTWPHNDEFWAMLLGQGLLGRLGLFHLMKRIVDTLNPRCSLYWRAMVDLKACFYKYNSKDEEALIASMKNGTFDKDGDELNDDAIAKLRRSKEWKSKCDPHLRKEIITEQLAINKTNGWINKYDGKTDESDRLLTNQKTASTIKEQQTHIPHIQDHPDFDPYRELPPGPRSKSGLSIWLSSRPESHLELFHLFLAHFGNSGMGPELADCLHLRGMAEWNLTIRHKIAASNGTAVCGNEVPAHLDSHPAFFDHHLMAFLNMVAEAKCVTPPFKNLTKLNEDNGEVFLSEYFHAQQQRNKADCCDPISRRCRCPDCSENPIPYIFGSTEARSEEIVEIRVPAPILIIPQRANIPLTIQPAVKPAVQIQPAVLPLLYYQQCHMPQVPQFPQQYFPPVPQGPPPICNCTKYRNYLWMRAMIGKMGRPPHDDNCPQRK
jgi:hypothetical protein